MTIIATVEADLRAALDEVQEWADAAPPGRTVILYIRHFDHTMPYLTLSLTHRDSQPWENNPPSKDIQVRVVDWEDETVWVEAEISRGDLGGTWKVRDAPRRLQPAGKDARKATVYREEYAPTVARLEADVLIPWLREHHATFYGGAEAASSVPEWTLIGANTELTRDQAAQVAGLKVETFDQYRSRGVIPEPDRMISRTPLWRAGTIRAWLANRPGRGAGGGRPRKGTQTGG